VFEKIDIGIRTFLRDEQLRHALIGVTENFPQARLIVVDDGEMSEEKKVWYENLRTYGRIIDILPFDSGFGVKSNRIVELSTRPYLLIGSDDFVFDMIAAGGLRELQRVLDTCPDVDIASGRVNFNPYEFYLEIFEYLFRKGIYVKEHPVGGSNRKMRVVSRLSSEWNCDSGCNLPYPTPEFFSCDLTVNYSLIRMNRFKAAGIAWDNDVKIGGGEHGAFFYDCKRAKLKTVCVPCANINEQKIRNNPRYKDFRNRANSPERPCFDKRGIVEYVLSDGRVDYRKD
jgi:hypothetical protein